MGSGLPEPKWQSHSLRLASLNLRAYHPPASSCSSYMGLLPILKHAKLISASGPLHVLFVLPLGTSCSRSPQGWHLLVFQISAHMSPPWSGFLSTQLKQHHPLYLPVKSLPRFRTREPWPPCGLLSTQPGTVSMEASGRPSGLHCAFAVFYRAGAGESASGKHRSAYWPARDEGAPPSAS